MPTEARQRLQDAIRASEEKDRQEEARENARVDAHIAQWLADREDEFQRRSRKGRKQSYEIIITPVLERDKMTDEQRKILPRLEEILGIAFGDKAKVGSVQDPVSKLWSFAIVIMSQDLRDLILKE